MDFNLFSYFTLGRRPELEAGLAGLRGELYQRMLDETAQIVALADEAGYAGFGHPEHHLQLEGFEPSNDLAALAMWIGRHSSRLKVISCGWVSTTHNPLRAAETISTLDNMLRGRFSFGLVRGYQYRWVENFKVRPELEAVGPWNKDTAADELNREYFAEYVDVVLKALTHRTFSHQGRFWQFPAEGMRNPHRHDVYASMGAGVRDDMTVDEVGIAPPPFQQPMPQLYAGFSASLRTALFWARHKGRPIVMSGNYDFCELLWSKYRDEAAKWGHDVERGSEAAWGGIVICAPTDAEARAQFEDMEWFWNTWSVPFGNPMPELLVGSPDTISAKIETARARFNPREAFMIIPQGIHPADQVCDSLGLFAEKVMPRFAD
jgi:alkanesulfonate monooxygenase SsuD/methylene tetrahydromethanopterin reductase-like flavin-dependent oxidoreductase (luciferase family)